MMNGIVLLVPARVWRPSLVVLLSQQTNMFEAGAAIARQAPRAVSNVQKILIFQTSKNKPNKWKRGGRGNQVEGLWNGPVFLPENTRRAPETGDEERLLLSAPPASVSLNRNSHIYITQAFLLFFLRKEQLC